MRSKEITYKGKPYIIEFEMHYDYLDLIEKASLFTIDRDFLYSLRHVRTNNTQSKKLIDSTGSTFYVEEFSNKPMSFLKTLIHYYEEYQPIEAFMREDIVID